MFNLFEKVNDITNGDRRRDYDHPLINHLRISIVWSVQTGTELNPIQVAWMLGAGLKLTRQISTSKLDNVVDNTGYMKCVIDMCRLFYELQYEDVGNKPEFNEAMVEHLMKELEDYSIGQQWDLLQHAINYYNNKLVDSINKTGTTNIVF